MKNTRENIKMLKQKNIKSEKNQSLLSPSPKNNSNVIKLIANNIIP